MATDKRVRRNNEIRVPKVRLIDEKGENIGVISTEDAMAKAKAVSLDLVEVSPMAEPPVCKIMDFGKFLFDKQKADQNARKKTKRTQLKEIKFRPGTDIGDYNTKLRKLREFLEAGDKTKITIRFRGREMAHQELGMELLKRVEADLEEHGNVEQRPSMEGRQMSMIIAPISKKK
ncbi:MAG: translation initiation factor IF-3 [Gammaproteobacteria bacterium]|nr:translation initiation factor IF-3 [Gammaproteobacteria bacterium]